MSTFLQLERKRLGLTASKVVEGINGSRATYTRWEAGSPIPSDKLALLAELGFDILYVVTGNRSTSAGKTLSDIPYQGLISLIVEALEEVLKENRKALPPASKGRIVEAIFEHCITNKQQPNRATIVPFLRAVGL